MADERPLTFGISRVRNEDDLIEWSLRRAVLQYDHVIIGEGNSTDDTRQIIEKVIGEGLPITVVDDTRPGPAQCDVMTEFAHLAGEMGATWVCPYDTDEAWFAHEPPVARQLEQLPPDILLVNVANVTHCSTDLDDPTDPDPMSRMGWRSKERLPLAKVACRIRPDLKIGHGNHDATYDEVRHPPRTQGFLTSHHFPYRTADQFLKRVEMAWPQLRDSGLPESHGAHMWGYGDLLDRAGSDAVRAWFTDRLSFRDPGSNPELMFDPLPPLEACP